MQNRNESDLTMQFWDQKKIRTLSFRVKVPSAFVAHDFKAASSICYGLAFEDQLRQDVVCSSTALDRDQIAAECGGIGKIDFSTAVK